MEYINTYIQNAIDIMNKLDFVQIEKVIQEICIVKRNKGRLFFLGVGGSAANASHAVNDFRKIANIECYAPTDNVSELTARTNDDGWAYVFEKWLEGSKLNDNDAIFILSVGGGNLEKNISVNLVRAIQYAKKVGADVLGIVSRDGGYTLQNADACILVPVINDKTVTPQAESFQSSLLHMIVSSPLIAENKAKWEGLEPMVIK